MKNFLTLTCFILLCGITYAGEHLTKFNNVKNVEAEHVTTILTRITSFTNTIKSKAGSPAKALDDFKGHIQSFKQTASSIHHTLHNTKPPKTAAKNINDKLDQLLGIVKKGTELAKTISSCTSIPSEWATNMEKLKDIHNNLVADVNMAAKNAEGTFVDDYLYEQLVDNEFVYGKFANVIRYGEAITTDIINHFLQAAEKQHWLAFIGDAILAQKENKRESFTHAMSKVNQLLRDAVETVIETAKTNVNKLIAVVPKDITETIANSKSIVHDIKQFLSGEKTQEEIHKMETQLKNVVHHAGDAFKGVSTMLASDFMSTVATFKDLVGEIIEVEVHEKQALLHKIGGVCKTIHSLPKTLKDYGTCIFKEGKGFVQKSFAYVTEVEKVIGALKETFTKCRTLAENKQKDCVEKSYEDYKHHVVKGAKQVLNQRKLHGNLEKHRQKCKNQIVKTFVKATVTSPNNTPQCSKD